MCSVCQHCCVLYRKAAKGVNPKGSHHKEQTGFSIPLRCIYTRGWMFTKSIVVTTYVSQIVMAHTLNWHRAVCQLDLNKTGNERIDEQMNNDGQKQIITH